MTRLIKSCYYKLRKTFDLKRTGFQGAGGFVSFCEPETGNDLLRNAILNSPQLMVARHGSNELMYVCKPKQTTFAELCGIAGFFPPVQSYGELFIKEYRSASAHIDLLAAWNYRHGRFSYEQSLFRLQRKNSYLIDIKSLNSFAYRLPWTSALNDKRVLIIHPFKDTIESQYFNHRKRLFRDPSVLPEFKSFTVVKAVQSMGGTHQNYATWFEALDFMKRSIYDLQFDVALIGCGAYGLPLASFVKTELNKTAIHVGGALQLLFGIKGRRWESNGYDYHLKYYNSHWVRPLASETPGNSSKFEESCYW